MIPAPTVSFVAPNHPRWRTIAAPLTAGGSTIGDRHTAAGVRHAVKRAVHALCDDALP